MFSILLVVIPFASSFVFDVAFNEFNSPYIQGGIVPGLFSVPEDEVEMFFTLGRSSIIDVGPWDATDPVLVTGEVLTLNNFPLCPFSHPALSFIDSPTPETEVSVAIGPGSFLVNNYNSTGLVRNGTDHGLFILGQSINEFTTQYCVTNSTLRIPFSVGRFGNRVNVSYSLIWSLSEIFTISQLNETTNLPVTISGHTKILKLPHSLSVEIEQSMNNVVWESESNFYRNCEVSILADLPHVVVTFFQIETSSHEMIGELILTPSDYMDFDSIGRTCFFRFAIEDDDTDFLSINPLVIPNVNFYLSNNELVLCDSLYQD